MRGYATINISNKLLNNQLSLRTGRARYRLALILLALSYVNYSFGGLLVRSLHEATPWQIVFWRALALGGFVAVVIVITHWRSIINEFRMLGRWGLLAGVINGVSPAGYIFALKFTTVANAIFILATIPFITAVLARVLIKEPLTQPILIAMPVAFTGMFIMVGGGVVAGAALGNLAALITAVCFACFVIILRHARTRNMQPCLVVSGVVGAILGLVANSGDVAVSLHDALLCITWGALLTGVGTLVLLFATRYVTGAEATFLMMLEFILGPIWVWLFVGEIPRMTTLIGGTVVLAAVGWWAYASARQ